MKLLDNWKPLYAIAGEDAGGGTTPEPDAGGSPPPPADGPGSGRSELRQQLEKNFETDRKATEKRGSAAQKSPRRVAGGAELVEGGEVQPPEGAEVVAGAEGEAPPAAIAPVGPAPEGFSKEAKAEWEKTPAKVQEAVLKRENDMAQGVAALKGRYTDLDQALQPHMEAIRRHGHTPAQAVNQLFSWFQALAQNPKVAFPALAKSFNMDLNALVGPAGQPQPGTEGQQPVGAIPPELQKYITDMQQEVLNLKQAFGQEVNGLKSTFQQQSEAKTQEILTNWSKDKPHFDAVRGLMANLIASGAIPLKEGQVDLDGAYEMAIYANPDVRTQVLTAQQDAAKKAADAKIAAEKVAQQTQADKARKAAVSVGGGAPGAPGGNIAGKPLAKRKSVRESIMEAREELQN